MIFLISPLRLHGIALAATCVICAIGTTVALPAAAQTGPSAFEIAQYQGLHAAAQKGDVTQIENLAASKAALNVKDGNGRTPLHAAIFARQRDAIRALVKAGADINLLDKDRYDGVTIASVADDEETLRVLLSLGANAKLITSRYDGIALIESIVLGNGGTRRQGSTPLQLARTRGYAEMVKILEKAGAR